MTNKYRCILFDCDGVLVDSEALAITTMLELVRPYGLDFDPVYALAEFTGKAFSYCRAALEDALGRPLPADFEQTFRAATYQVFAEKLQPVAGVHALLERLPLPVGVASNGPMEKIRLNLHLTRLLPRFEGNIFSAYDIQRWKPDPQLYLHAAATMGFRPEECAVVEDSLAGVTAARAGGFDVYGLAHGRTAAALALAGARVVRHLDELAPLLV